MPKTRNFTRRTKIVSTLGPASSSSAVIERLIKAGMSVARLNLSHGTHREHARHIQTVRKLSRRLSFPVAIMIDLPGPKYRTGKLRDGPVVLKKGARVVLTTRLVAGTEAEVSVNLPTFPQDVRLGDTVLLDDGAMELKVRSISGTEVICRVVAGGRLTPGRGIAIPGRPISAPFISDRFREHVAFATRQQPDYLALSFVDGPEDVAQARALLKQAKANIPIIVKIERGQAVASFDRILAVSDGIMVARGDLGVDIPLERVPLVQK